MDSPDVADARSDAKRKRVKKACVPCSKAHTSCDSSKNVLRKISYQWVRPCKRCVDKGILDQCVDKQRKPRTQFTELTVNATSQIGRKSDSQY